MEQRKEEKYLTKGNIECDCGNKWHYETLGDYIICGKCKKKHKVEGERVLFEPEVQEEKEVVEDDGEVQ